MAGGTRSPSRGLRLLRRLLTFAGVVAAAAAAVVAARRRRDAAAPPPTLAPSPVASLPPAGGPAHADAAPAEEPAPAHAPPVRRPARTRQELYREAQAVGLKGRSKMTKAQLERALEEHRRD